MTHASKVLASVGVGLTLISVMVGCGGGGGGGGGGVSPTDVPELPKPEAQKLPDPPPEVGDTPDAFWFYPEPKLRKGKWLLRAINGQVTAGWDPTLPPGSGMEFGFFGQAIGCPPPGPRDPIGGAVELTDFAAAPQQVLQTGLKALPGVGARQMLWRPTGNSPSCTADAQARRGPSLIDVDWDVMEGGFGMYTPSGDAVVGAAPLLAPFGTTGQGNTGANAHILGTFIGWRNAWNGAAPRRPWVGTSASAQNEPTARIYSVQSVTKLTVSSTAPGGIAQAKQQVVATFINAACVEAGLHPARPCQVQYLFNVSVARAGVSDWSQVDWFQEGQVSYDPGQGGIPVVDGRLKAVGQTTLDRQSRLPLFTSRGSATQHGTFAAQAFDARISMDQLGNALRLTTASTLGKALDSLTTRDIESVWGPQWDHPESWYLLQSHLGQEVYNDRPSAQTAVVGGKVTFIYIGTAP